MRITPLFLLLTIFFSQPASGFFIQSGDTLAAHQFFTKGEDFSKATDYIAAAEKFEAAAIAFKKEDYWQRYADVIIKQSKALLSGREFSNAEKVLTDFLQKKSEIPSDFETIIYDIYNALGAHYNVTGEYSKALEAGEKALEGQTRLFNGKGAKVADAAFTVGNSYLNSDEHELALDYFNNALSIYTQLKDKLSIAMITEEMGMNYFFSGNKKKAIEHFERAKVLFLQIYDEADPGMYITYSRLAIYYSNAEKDIERAAKFMKKALKIALKHFGDTHYKTINAYHNLGFIYADSEYIDSTVLYTEKAAVLYSKSFGSRHDNIQKCWSLLAGAFIKKNKFERAIHYRHKAIQVTVPEFKPKDIFENPTITRFNANTDLVYHLSDKGYDFEDMYRYGDEKDLRFLEAAMAAFELSAKTAEFAKNKLETEGSKISLLSQDAFKTHAAGVDIAFKLFELTGDEKYFEKAFYFTEKSKANLLFDAITEKKSMQFAGLPSRLSEEEEALRIRPDSLAKLIYDLERKDEKGLDEAIVRLSAELVAAKKDYLEFIDQLERDYPEYYRLKYSSSVADLEAIRNYLPDEKTTYISFFDDSPGDVFYALTISKNKTNFRKIETGEEFNDSVRSFVNLLNNNELAIVKGGNAELFDDFRMEARALYKDLFADQIFQSDESLIIIPDGILNYLPFDILLTDEVSNSSVNYAGLPYLIKQHPIRYARSGTMLLLSENRKRSSGKGLLAFAPKYDKPRNKFLASRDGFGALQYTKSEVNAIVELMGGKHLVDEKATESQFKKTAGGKQILHLAGHAFTNEEKPMFSGLIFSNIGDTSEDNTLHAYELYNMELNADLAVLSACNTGSGKFTKGEGVMSLARSFRHAGCPNIVMSLWQADDEATAQIMEDFYQNLKAGIGKDEALRRAKLGYLESSPRTFPHYWAAFVLNGDEKPINMNSRNTYYLFAGAFLPVLALVGFYYLFGINSKK